MKKKCDTTFEVDGVIEKKQQKKIIKEYYGDISASNGWDWEAIYED